MHLTQYFSNKNYWNKQLPLKEQGHNGFPEIKPLVIMDGWNKFCEINTVSLTVSGQLPSRKSPPRLGLGFGLGLVLKLELRDNFPPGQLS